MKAHDTLSSPFQVTTGITQGSILTLLLFDVIIHWVVRKTITYCTFGINFDDMNIIYLDFADDNCLLEDDSTAAKELLSSVIAAASETGLIINAKKTQALFSKNDSETLNCGDDVPKNIGHFNYMWRITKRWNNITKENKNQIVKSTNRSKRLSIFWKSKQPLQKLKGEAPPNVRAKCPTAREWKLNPEEIRHQGHSCIWKQMRAPFF